MSKKSRRCVPACCASERHTATVPARHDDTRAALSYSVHVLPAHRPSRQGLDLVVPLLTRASLPFCLSSAHKSLLSALVCSPRLPKQRHYSLHNAHLVLTVFKLYDKRTSYDQLRDQLITATENEVATFDDFVMGVPICDTHLCIMTSDVILGMRASPSSSDSGGGGSAAPPGPGDPGAFHPQQRQGGRPPLPIPPRAGSSAVQDSSATSGTSGTSGGGPSNPAGAWERPRPVVAIGGGGGGGIKEEVHWGPEKEGGVAVSPHSDTAGIAAAAVAWTEAWGDSARGGDAPAAAAAAATVPPGASRYTVPPMSRDGTDGRQQQEIGALPWDEHSGGLHGVGRGGDCQQQQQQQQQQQDLSGVEAVDPRVAGVPFSPRVADVPFSPRGISAPFSPRGTGEPFMPMQGEGTAARGGPQYSGSGGGGGGRGLTGQRDGECYGGAIPQVPWDNSPEAVGGGRAALGGETTRGDRGSGGVCEYQPPEQQSHPSASVGIAPVLESLRAQTAAKQERHQRLQYQEQAPQPSAYAAGVSGGAPCVNVHDQVHQTSQPRSAGATPDSAGADAVVGALSVAESVHPPTIAAAEEKRLVSGSCGSPGVKTASGGGDGGDSNNNEGEGGGTEHSDLVSMLLDD